MLTGIDKTHPDLVGKTDGINFLGAAWPGNQNYADTSGHGTGIAGIIAANDNTIGVVGVAPEVTLYSVKVREKSGTVYPDGYPTHTEYNFTALCNGMKWCIMGPDGTPDTGDEPGIQVINFSLGIWTVTSDGQREYPLHDHEFYNLIHEASQRGIVIVAAAGNSSRSIGIYNNPDTDQDVVFSDMSYDFPASYPEVIAVSATAMKTTGKPSER